jgi:D-alanyl-D-alanine dipeptidase
LNVLLLLTTMLSATPATLEEVKARIPDVVVDLRYATKDNFIHQQVYPTGARALLVTEAIDKLKVAADALRAKGFRLKLWDCYRPRSVQEALWKAMPRIGFVADPKTGSHHNRGAAIDVSLVDLNGKDVDMPTGFDDFSKASRHFYAGGSAASRQHRDLLKEAMEAAGFKRNYMEWWHWELPEAVKYPLRDDPVSAETH